MTETEWQSLADPKAMVAFLRKTPDTSERKARLFACACCRRVWHLLDEECQEILAVVGQYADGHAPESELAHAHKRARRIYAELEVQRTFNEKQVHDATSGAVMAVG